MKIRWLFAAMVVVILGTVARPANAGCTFARVAELPVTFSEGRLLIPAKINGSDIQLAVDSGAFFSMISPSGVARYKLSARMSPYDVIIEGAGGHGGFAQIANAHDFEIFGVTFHNVDFLLGERGFGNGVEGLLGQNFLGALDVEYDLPDGVIRLFKATGCSNSDLAYWTTPSQAEAEMPLDDGNRGGLPMQTGGMATINGVNIHVIFDTGAPVSMIDQRAAARAGVKPTDPGVTGGSYASGANQGSYFRTWLAPFADFKMGGEEVKGFKLRVGDLQLGGATEMLIGDDYIRSHRILVANSQHKIYFTYSGGPVFDMKGPPQTVPATGGDAPPGVAAVDTTAKLDADGYNRRAADYSARGDNADAVADLTSAIQLNPHEPRYYVERGQAEERMLASLAKPPHLPMEDFNQALTIKPGYIRALLARSNLHLLRKEPLLAKADLDAADQAAAAEPAARLNIASAYGAQGDYAQALPELDQWIVANPHDDRMAQALDERCRARGLLNQDLNKALADCNAALKLAPGDPSALESRGLVRLRMTDLDGAIRDYSDAIRLNPSNPWSLYGRGVAKLHKGLSAEGQADIQAATALRPKIAEQAGKYAIAP